MADRPAPSPIRAVFDRAAELERAGRSIVHMEIGRPHVGPPAAAIEAARDALSAGVVHYTASRGLAELRAALGERYGYDPETEVVVTAGGSEAVAGSCLALLGPGDEAIVLDPGWPHYAAHIALAGATPVHVPCSADDAFVPDPEQVRAAVTPRTRMLVVSSPGNPTGAVIPPPVLEALAALCHEHDLVALSDEIYESFVYDGAQHASIAGQPGMRERTVVANSFSKTYAMTGWRVGWAAAPAGLAERVNTVHQYLTVCAPAFAQVGALAALSHGHEFVEATVGEYADRRRALVAAIEAIDDLELRAPAGAFYAFPRLRGRSGTSVARDLLESAGVATVPGAAFGAAYEQHLRLSYAVSEEALADGLERLRGFFGG